MAIEVNITTASQYTVPMSNYSYLENVLIGDDRYKDALIVYPEFGSSIDLTYFGKDSDTPVATEIVMRLPNIYGRYSLVRAD